MKATSTCKTDLMCVPKDEIKANPWIYFVQPQWVTSFGTSVSSLSTKFILLNNKKTWFLVLSLLNPYLMQK
jgi:hypothetical protein